MSIRQTSIDCYNQIKAEGLLSRKRLEIYEALLKIGKPSTVREVYEIMGVVKQESTRFTELRNMGVIYEAGIRKCGITGRTSIEWDLTDRLPIEVKRNADTKKNRLNSAINALWELYKVKNTSTQQDWENVSDLINRI